jgi:hypothetical protein
MTDSISAYPLHWSAWKPRNQTPRASAFKTDLVKARNGLQAELRRLGAANVVISSNAELTADGRIAARQRRLIDTGIAVYFDLDGEAMCFACDEYILLEDNVHAISLTIEALRGIER